MSHDYWPTGLGWSIDIGLRRNRELKGRVLAIWQDTAHSKTPIAVLCWHLHDSGPLYIFDGGCIDDVEDESRYMSILFLCLRQIAGHRAIDRDEDTLRWSLAHLDRAPRRDQSTFRRAAQERAQRFGFATFQGSRRPGWTQGWWLGERAF